MTSESLFYSKRRQFLRCLAADWRLHGRQFFYGVLYASAGFFIVRRTGVSQVYDVMVPFVVAIFVLVKLTDSICGADVARITAPYYLGLPRERATAFDARAAFLFLLATSFVGLVFLGSLLKFGGAGITPHYRLSPDWAALPFLAASAALWEVYRRGDMLRHLVLVVGVAAVVYWFEEKVRMRIAPSPANNYLPMRAMALWRESAAACGMALAAVFLVLSTRRHWATRQIGERR